MAQSIQNIREKRDEIREKIKTLNLKNYENQRFGVENEYTYKSLIGEVESLLTDLSTLTQHENKFIKLSNYNERRQIADNLINILSYLESPTNLYSYIEDLKIILRTYNIRNFSENLIQFEEEIDDIKRTRVELEEVLAISCELQEKFNDKSDEIVKLYDEADKSFKDIQEKFKEIKNELELICKETEIANGLNDDLEEIKEKLVDLNVFVHSFEAGEQNKHLDTVSQIYETLILNKFDRKDILFALGGGVVGDICGFVAATYLRGIDFIQIPTTLLSQVDSSIGGKTGVDFKQYKNMVGAFYMPKLVYVNINTLKTLPKSEFSSGMGEVIKHGLIADKDYYYKLYQNRKKILEGDSKTLADMVFAAKK